MRGVNENPASSLVKDNAIPILRVADIKNMNVHNELLRRQQDDRTLDLCRKGTNSIAERRSGKRER